MTSAFVKAVLHNFRYKVAAFMLAGIFWYIIQGEEILEVNQKLIITIDVPEGFIVKDGNTRIKDITIRGPRVLVGDAATKPPFEAHIAVPITRTGMQRLRVDKEFIKDWDARKTLT